MGANEIGHHLKGFVPSRDTKPKHFRADLRLAKSGDFIGDDEVVLKKVLKLVTSSNWETNIPRVLKSLF